MGRAEQEMAALLSVARIHPPGEREAWDWYWTVTLRPAVHWALTQEARRPKCIWTVKQSKFPSLSTGNLAAARGWLALRKHRWDSGCTIGGEAATVESPASRKLKALLPSPDSTADVFERYAAAIPPLACSWAAEFPQILKRRPKFPRGYPLLAMAEAASLVRDMAERFPAKVHQDGFQPIELEDLPDWTRIFLFLRTWV